MLSGEVLEGDEAYEFTWTGKKAALVEANMPIRMTLRPCLEESVNWDTTENLYIEGDNLNVPMSSCEKRYLRLIQSCAFRKSISGSKRAAWMKSNPKMR